MTSALVADEGQRLIEEVRIAKEVIAEQVEGVATVIGATPDSAFSPPNLARNRRKALVNKLSVVKMHVAQAEAEPDPKRKDQFLDQAVAKVVKASDFQSIHSRGLQSTPGIERTKLSAAKGRRQCEREYPGSGKWKSFSGIRSPARNRMQLRHREVGWGAAGGE